MLTIAKKMFILMSLVGLVGLIGSCEEKEVTIWDDSAAPTLIDMSPSSALVGEEITITGKYFSSKANNSVSFGGIEATITGANISVITAILPEGATSGDAMVTSDGLQSTNSLSYTVIQPIIPTITSIDPVKGKIGQTVIITGTDFSTTPAENVVSFNGARASVTESTATTITTTVPAGATTGDVTVTRDGESNGISFTVTASYTVIATIATKADDAEEGAANGAMALTSSDLELGDYDTWAAKDDVEQGVQTVGIRFIDLDIPVGANVLSASIQFECDATGADPAQMTIYGENIGDAPGFVEEIDYNISSRTTTTENVVWEIPEWVEKQDRGPAQQTPSLINIVQEILNRGDWAPGNSMVFILKPSGSTVDETSSSGGREAEADPGDDAATLTIVYELEF